MPIFTYTALKEGKSVISGKIEADSLRDARESLRRMNLIPTKIDEQGAAPRSGKDIKNIGSTRRERTKEKTEEKRVKSQKPQKFKLREKIDFTNSLFVLSKTGVSLIESLLFIEANTNSKNTQSITAELRRSILSGTNLSDSMLRFPDSFDQVYSGLIRAGEESGELDTTLERLIHVLNKQDKLKGKVISTLAYPCFVILLAMAVTTIMITFVFPAFRDTYAASGMKLPIITQIFMDLGTFLKKYWILIPLGFGGLIGGTIYLFKWPTTRKIVDSIALQIPIISTFVKYVNLSNFITILRVCFEAGVPVVDGMMLANRSIVNTKLRQAMWDVTTKIQHGQSLSGSLRASELIPGIIMCMIATGEESGQLSETLKQAEFYIDNQIENIVDILNKLFEPLLLLIIGGIVLVLALALYLPLFKNYANMIG